MNFVEEEHSKKRNYEYSEWKNRTGLIRSFRERKQHQFCLAPVHVLICSFQESFVVVTFFLLPNTEANILGLCSCICAVEPMCAHLQHLKQTNLSFYVFCSSLRDRIQTSSQLLRSSC